MKAAVLTSGRRPVRDSIRVAREEDAPLDDAARQALLNLLPVILARDVHLPVDREVHGSRRKVGIGPRNARAARPAGR